MNKHVTLNFVLQTLYPSSYKMILYEEHRLSVIVNFSNIIVTSLYNHWSSAFLYIYIYIYMDSQYVYYIQAEVNVSILIPATKTRKIVLLFQTWNESHHINFYEYDNFNYMRFLEYESIYRIFICIYQIRHISSFLLFSLSKPKFMADTWMLNLLHYIVHIHSIITV